MKFYYRRVRILSKEQALLSVSMEISPAPRGAPASRGIVQLCQLQLGKHTAGEYACGHPAGLGSAAARHVCAALAEALSSATGFHLLGTAAAQWIELG